MSIYVCRDTGSDISALVTAGNQEEAALIFAVGTYRDGIRLTGKGIDVCLMEDKELNTIFKEEKDNG